MNPNPDDDDAAAAAAAGDDDQSNTEGTAAAAEDEHDKTVVVETTEVTAEEEEDDDDDEAATSSSPDGSSSIRSRSMDSPTNNPTTTISQDENDEDDKPEETAENGDDQQQQSPDIVDAHREEAPPPSPEIQQQPGAVAVTPNDSTTTTTTTTEQPQEPTQDNMMLPLVSEQQEQLATTTLAEQLQKKQYLSAQGADKSTAVAQQPGAMAVTPNDLTTTTTAMTEQPEEPHDDSLVSEQQKQHTTTLAQQLQKKQYLSAQEPRGGDSNDDVVAEDPPGRKSNETTTTDDNDEAATATTATTATTTATATTDVRTSVTDFLRRSKRGYLPSAAALAEQLGEPASEEIVFADNDSYSSNEPPTTPGNSEPPTPGNSQAFTLPPPTTRPGNNDNGATITPGNSEPFMVQATAVPEVQEAIVIEDLDQLAHDRNDEKERKWQEAQKNKRQTCLVATILVGVLLAAALAIGLGVGLSNNMNKDSDSSTLLSGEEEETNAPKTPTTPAPVPPSVSPTTTTTVMPSAVPSTMPTRTPETVFYQEVLELYLPNIDNGQRTLSRISGRSKLHTPLWNDSLVDDDSLLLSKWQFLSQDNVAGNRLFYANETFYQQSNECVRYGSDVIVILKAVNEELHLRGRGGSARTGFVATAGDLSRETVSPRFNWILQSTFDDLTFKEDPKNGECLLYGEVFHLRLGVGVYLTGGMGDGGDEVKCPRTSDLSFVTGFGQWAVRKAESVPTAPISPPTVSPTLSLAPTRVNSMFYRDVISLDFPNDDQAVVKIGSELLENPPTYLGVRTLPNNGTSRFHWQVMSDIYNTPNLKDGSQCVRYGDNIAFKGEGGASDYYLRGQGGAQPSYSVNAGLAAREVAGNSGKRNHYNFVFRSSLGSITSQDPRHGECVSYDDSDVLIGAFISINNVLKWLVGGVGDANDKAETIGLHLMPTTNASKTWVLEFVSK